MLLVVAAVLLVVAGVLLLPLVAQMAQMKDETAGLRRELTALADLRAELAETGRRAGALRDAVNAYRSR